MIGDDDQSKLMRMEDLLHQPPLISAFEPDEELYRVSSVLESDSSNDSAKKPSPKNLDISEVYDSL